jgi:hypothetical protein
MLHYYIPYLAVLPDTDTSLQIMHTPKLLQQQKLQQRGCRTPYTQLDLGTLHSTISVLLLAALVFSTGGHALPAARRPGTREAGWAKLAGESYHKHAAGHVSTHMPKHRWQRLVVSCSTCMLATLHYPATQESQHCGLLGNVRFGFV